MPLFRSILNAAMILLIAFGMAAFFGGLLCSTSLGNHMNHVEFPLGDVQGIAVDSQGRIYCALQFYQRVQVYDRQGKFLNGWHIPSSSERFYLHLRGDDRLEVVMSKSYKSYLYNYHGELLGSCLCPFADMVHQFHNSNFCFDSKGNSYRITHALINPKIKKTDSKGKSAIFIRMSLFQTIVSAPTVAWLLILIGLIILTVTDMTEYPPMLMLTIYQKKKHRSQQEHQSISIPITIYLLLEPLSIMVGTVSGAIILMLLQRHMDLTSFSAMAIMAISIMISYILIKNTFRPKCRLSGCQGKSIKTSNSPVTYQCEKCGDLYVCNIDDVESL